jgi:peptidoglycan/LPS O-acetylase OafA/YrhL
MLETVVVNSLGSNGPLWSLAFEWWYYCLFCLFVGGLLSRGWLRLVMLGVLPIFVWALPSSLFLWMLIWLMGIATYFIVKRARSTPNPIIGCAVLILVLIIAVLSQNPDNLHNPEPKWMAFSRDCVVALAFCFTLYCFGRAERGLMNSSFHHWAADFSYTMYLLHFPAMLFIVAAANHLFGWPFLMTLSAAGIFYLIALVIALYILGYLFSLVTERYTGSVKTFMKREIAKISIVERIFNASRGAT